MTAAATYWSAASARGYAPNWYSFCGNEIVRRVTGQTDLSCSLYFLSKYAKLPVGTLLEIGCLSGDKLMSMVAGGIAQRGFGIDIAAGAIAAGIERHGSALDLRVMDLNAPEPVAQTFDAISINGVLHHIENLEACAEWLRDHLAPEGTIVASEFTGPVRYKYTRHEIDLINEGVSYLPAELRDPFDPIQLKCKLDADPSESVRSRDIPDVLRSAGLSVELHPYGGNVLMRALGQTFFSRFDPGNSVHVSAFERLAEFDAAVMAKEPSHHQFIVARHHAP